MLLKTSRVVNRDCLVLNYQHHYVGDVLAGHIVQELSESRGGRPELSVLTSFSVSVDVKIYSTMLQHWSQLVPNMSTDI